MLPSRCTLGMLWILSKCSGIVAQAESEASVYHTSKVVSTGGVEVQTVGKDFLWVGRAETRVKTFGANKTTLGFNAARLVDEGVLPRKVRRPPNPRSYSPRDEYFIKHSESVPDSCCFLAFVPIIHFSACSA